MSNNNKADIKNLWDRAYPSNVNWNFEAVNKPVNRIFEDVAAKHPKSPCVDFLGKNYSYADMKKFMLRVAAGLQAKGVKKGDRIGLCLPNTPYYIACYYAILKIGGTVVNFNPLYTKEEIKAQIEDSGIEMMITIDVKAIFEKVHFSLDKTSLKHIVFCPLASILPPVKRILFKLFKASEIMHIQASDKITSFNKLCSHGDKVTAVDINPSEDVALFQYTGGTTGVPKAAILTHSNVSSNAEQVRLWLASTGKTSHETFLGVLPFFHVFAMTAVMNLSIITASKLILLPRFDIMQVLKAIRKNKPTVFPAVPTIFNALSHHPKIKNYDLSSIDFCISGGATLPSSVKSAFESLAKCTVVEGYGLSETSPVTNCNPPTTGGKIGSIGLPLPGTKVEIRDIKDPSITLEQGERGELVIKGPQVMLSYHNRPDETAKVFTEDGWLRTGDVGYIDDDGYVFLTDRLKEIIISNGYNVYPKVIEEAFYRHGDVEEVIVIGIPDEHKGEVPKAFVKLKEGATVSNAQLLEFVVKLLNPLEKPKELEFRKELPKTLIGKLSKKELVQEEAEKRSTHS